MRTKALKSKNNSGKLSHDFLTWYMKNSLTNHLTPLNNNSAESLFTEFLKESPQAKADLNALSSSELNYYNNVDSAFAANFLNTIQNDSHVVSPEIITTNTSTVYIIPDTVNLPSGVSSNGEYGMVQVNYFIYHAPWWLGGWSVTYGEHDVINALFTGSYGQSFYNKEQLSSTLPEAEGIAAIILGVGLAAAPETLGISGVAAALIAGAVAAGGLITQAFIDNFNHAISNVYQSSWSDQPAGKKFMWVFVGVDYYYPSVTVVGVLASTESMYGYEVSGSSLVSTTLIPWYEGTTAKAVALSGYAQNSGSSHGWNTWYTSSVAL